MTQDELMTMMYHSKKQGKWMGDRPQKDMDCFNKLCTEWKESHPEEEMSQELINKFWLIASRGECNRRISGQGSLYRKMDNVLNPAAHAPSVQSSPTSFLPPQVGSPPAPTPPLPCLVSPTPRVASLSRYESSIEARIQQQDELIVQLPQQLHQERQQRLDTNRPHVIVPSTTTSSSNMSFQTIPSSNVSFQAIPSSNLAFQPIPSSNLMIPTMPSSNLSFQAMPSSNMSYQAMLQSTEPSAYQDMSAGMFGPSAGPSAGPTVGPSAGPIVGVGSQFYGDGNARRN